MTAGEPRGVAELEQLIAEAEVEAAKLSSAQREAHREWRQPRKLVAGQARPGCPAASLTLLETLRGELRVARYVAARAAQPGPCDCGVIEALRMWWQRPDSPTLRCLSGDGQYVAEYVCEACGKLWTELRDCDDVGVRSEWRPTQRGA